MKRKWLLLGFLLGAACEPLDTGPGERQDTGAAALMGKWRGEVAGIGVTVDVRQNYGQVLGGTLSTTKSTCFNTGNLSASIANTSIMMASTGAGSASSFTIVTVAGELVAGRVEGLFSMTAGSSARDECDVPDARIVLTR